MNAIVISSARVAKLAFKDNDLAIANRPILGLEKHSYNGNDITFSKYNETWRELRKLSVIHLFSVKQVASFYPIRRDQLTGSHVELDSWKNYEELEERRFDKVFKECQELAGAFYFGDHFPLLGWIDKLNGMKSRIDNNFRILDYFYQGLIDEHLDPNRPESMRGDILDLLIKLKQDQAAAVPLKWENIKGILMNVFIAGTDTSSSTLVWALLIKHPQAMKKAQEEVRNIVGTKGTVDEVDIQSLPYLKAIIKETLRLFPPVPLSLPKETIDKCTIDGYEIPAKTTVYMNTHAIGLDPEYWENPTEFMPDRFLNSTIDYKGHDYGLLPFGTAEEDAPE
ncbi:hypothetical protein F511_44298 [Dorcoceras hygrometricum]|uniref:Cytochrome P450 n=1 Tax=Dorcoceras hygrometricum TaxID=472368 RepID=A0A2Z7A958_9LAMI|nr:hypothetical protein F511_44298 [Dorcoceras hygrometricum]